MIKETPIAYSTAMLEQIFALNKSQTRRSLIPQPLRLERIDYDDGFARPLFEYAQNHSPEKGWCMVSPKCPYGWPGDVLWVRESWSLTGTNQDQTEMRIDYRTQDYMWTIIYDPTGDSSWIEKQKQRYIDKGIIAFDDVQDRFFQKRSFPWKPARFMPKVGARIWLKLLKVGVERVQDISDEDIVKEGVSNRTEWKELWIDLNGPQSWKQNVWVWVLDFDVISVTGKPTLL